MPTLTREQEEASRKRVIEIYGSLERIEELNRDNSVRTFWSSRSDRLSMKLREIDMDQATALTEYFKRVIPPRIPYAAVPWGI